MHVHVHIGRRHVLPAPIGQNAVDELPPLAEVGSQELVALAAAQTVHVVPREEQRAGAVALLRLSVANVVDVGGNGADSPAVVEVLDTLSVSLVLAELIFRQRVTLGSQLEDAYSLSVLEVALVVGLVVHVEFSSPIVLFVRVGAGVQQSTLAIVFVSGHADDLALVVVLRIHYRNHALVVVLSIHADGDVVLRQDGSDALVAEVRVIDPLVVVIVVEEHAHHDDGHRAVILQQLDRLAVAVARKRVEVVDDTCDYLCVTFLDHCYRVLVRENEVQDVGNTGVVVAVGDDAEQLSHVDLALARAHLLDHVDVLVVHVQDEGERATDVLEVSRNTRLYASVHRIRKLVDECLLLQRRLL